MLNIDITRNTATSLKFTLGSSISFNSAILWFQPNNSIEISELDRYDAQTGESINSVMKVDVATGEITIDLNKLAFDSIYYKNYSVEFLDASDVTVDKTVSFQISPQGKESLYGIVNKLTYEFNIMAKFSGTSLRIFTKSLTDGKCALCWDDELGQAISSTCDCAGSGYTMQDIISRKIKTQSKQEFNDAGAKIREQAVYQTYERPDLVKGSLFADLGDKEIYEVADRTIANIGGVRTSTMLIGGLIKANDSRVQKILDLLD